MSGAAASHPALARFLRGLAARDASPNTRRVVRDGRRGVPRLARRARRRLADGRRARDLRAYLAELGLARRPQLDGPAARGDPLVPPLRGPRRASPPATRGARSRRRACRAACRASSRSTRSSGCSRSSTRSWPRPAARAAGGARDRDRAPRPGDRRDRLCRRAPDQRAGRGRPRVARPAARRDPGPRQGPQGADRAAGPAGPRGARAPTSRTAGPCSSSSARGHGAGTTDDAPTEIFLNHRGRPLGVRGLRYRLDLLRRRAGPAGRRLAAHAPPLVRDAPARRRRGPAGRPGAARPREPRDDAGLHARLAGPPAGRLPGRPSAGARPAADGAPDGDAAS